LKPPTSVLNQVSFTGATFFATLKNPPGGVEKNGWAVEKEYGFGSPLLNGTQFLEGDPMVMQKCMR